MDTFSLELEQSLKKLAITEELQKEQFILNYKHLLEDITEGTVSFEDETNGSEASKLSFCSSLVQVKVKKELLKINETVNLIEIIEEFPTEEMKNESDATLIFKIQLYYFTILMHYELTKNKDAVQKTYECDFKLKDIHIQKHTD